MINLFTYKITGTGWAEMTLGTKSNHFCVPFSYSSEPLPELLTSLVKLLNSESRFELVVFDRENREYSLLMSLIDYDIIKIDIIEDAYFTVFKPDLTEATPKTMFTIYDNITCFIEYVLKELRKYTSTDLSDFYLEKWTRAFPFKELSDLEYNFRTRR